MKLYEKYWKTGSRKTTLILIVVVFMFILLLFVVLNQQKNDFGTYDNNGICISEEKCIIECPKRIVNGCKIVFDENYTGVNITKGGWSTQYYFNNNETRTITWKIYYM